MKITAKVSFSGLNFSAVSGQVLDLPEEIANDLIRAGYADAESAKTQKAEAKKAEANNEDKRDNAGTDTKSAPRKRGSSKRS